MPGVQSLPVEGAMYAFPQVASAEVKAYQFPPNDRKWSSARGVQ